MIFVELIFLIRIFLIVGIFRFGEEGTLIHGDVEIFSEKGVVPRAFCLCDTCVQDIATIIDKYKTERKREKF